MFSYINIIIFVAILVGLVIVASIIVSNMNLKKRKSGLQIADTSAFVIAIRQIAELTTFCFFEEKIMVERKAKDIVDNKISNLIASKLHKQDGFLVSDEICIIAKGIVRAGYKLDKLTGKDIRIIDGVLQIKLPQAEILDVIVNPKGYDFYVEDGDWNEEQVKEIKTQAKEQIKNDALKLGIIEKATKNGEAKLKALFLSFGFKDVVLEYQE